jgi:UDP-MurNAc hydroxylase
MRVTVIGHSCLRLQTAAGTIVVDPWLSGSCYWRSWWHFPPSAEPDADLLSPDYVYLTHHHFDHFHYPSMRRIDRSAQVLVPRFGVDVMAGEVAGLGFERPRELPHGRVVDLGNGVRVASFQYGFDDTAFVVADGDTVVVDINDAKIRGRTLRQVTRRFGRPTIVCKSHSFAQSYPILYEADDPEDLTLVTRDTYIDDFFEAMQTLRPRYAIPFGSMVAFLHPESRSVNDHLVTPDDVVAGMARRGGVDGTEVVTMAPGDSWSSSDGFDRGDFDWYADRAGHLAQLERRHGAQITAQAVAEAGRAFEWDDFERHFGSFVKAVPRIVGRRLVPRRIVFRIGSDAATPYWWLSLRDRTFGRAAAPPLDRAGVIHVSEAVLADAVRDRITHVIHGSMRIRTELTAGGTESDLAFWGLLMIWELGYLPVRRSLLRPRIWMTVIRRWRELLDHLPLMFRPDPVGRMAERFGGDASGSGRAADGSPYRAGRSG